MEFLAIDTETHTFSNGDMAPRVVCLTTSDGHSTEIFVGRDIQDRVQEILASDVAIVGHNVSYDFACLASTFGELQPEIWEAYDKQVVHCTLMRERLLDIASNETLQKYALDVVAFKHGFPQAVQKDNYWRRKFAELENLPLVKWPETAKQYALLDATAAHHIAVSQSTIADSNGYEHFEAESARQSAYDFALRLMSVWGVRTDGEKVKTLEQATQARISEMREFLVAGGFLRSLGNKLSKDTRKIQSLVAAEIEKPELTPTGKIKIGKNILESCKNPGLQALIEWDSLNKAQSTYINKLWEGVSGNVHATFRTLGAASGRTSCSSPNLQNQGRSGGIRECFVARPGYVYVICDYDSQETRVLAQVLFALLGRSSLAEKYRADPEYDPHTDFASQLMGISYSEAIELRKAGDKELLDRRQQSKACFHPDTEILTKSRGWIRIGELTYEDHVAAAYPQSAGHSIIAWEKPIALTKRKAPKGRLVHLKNEGMNLRVTDDHRMLAFGANGEPFVTTPEKMGDARRWGNAGVISRGEMPGGSREWSLLRLAVAVQADGSFTPAGIRLGFSKGRKIERLRHLLKDLGEPINWSMSKPNKHGAISFYLKKPLAVRIKRLLTPKKTIPLWWVSLPLGFRKIILDEIRHWDASVISGKRFAYFTTIKENADHVQAIASLCGHKSRMVLEKNCYRVSVGGHSYSRGGSLETTSIAYKGSVVCLSVPSSYVLVRDGGVPVVVGQCNFGFPGGLGALTFQNYAKGFGLDLTIDQCQDLKAKWMESIPEMREYFKIVSDLCDNGGVFEQIYSGRIRAGCTYTSGANTFFQGLASDASKTAAWLVSRACYEGRGALRGSRPVMFIHDELIIESREESAPEAAVELQTLMVKAMNLWCPDVPARAAPKISKYWEK